MFQGLERQLICPDYLLPQVQVGTADLLHGLGYRYKKPQISLADPQDFQNVTSSLQVFKREINTGAVNEFISYHLKTNESLPTGNFVISEPIFGGRAPFWENSYFVLDGNFGFFLGYHEKERRSNLWLCGTTFSSDEASSLIILQLQTVKHHQSSSPEYQNEQFRTREILQKLRWERVLVALAVEWARKMDFATVCIRPAHMNPQVWDGRLPQDRAKVRYDVTAQRLGFKQLPSGMYAMLI